jgi:hypothetical protein
MQQHLLEQSAGETRDAALEVALAEGHLFVDEGDEALTFTNDALQMFQKTGDDSGPADALGLMIGAFRSKGVNAAAMQGAYDELSKLKAAKDKKGEASMLMSIAEGKLAQDSPEEALTLLADAGARFRESGDKQKEGDSLLMYVKACCKRDRRDEALKAGNDALALFKGVNDKAGESKALLAIAAAHVAAGNIDEGRKVAESALELSKAVDSKKLEISALLMLADMFLLKEWSRQSAQKAQQALTLSRTLGFSRGEGMALNTLALALTASGETKEAQKIAEDGLARFQAKGNRKGQIAAYNALVHIFVEKDEPEVALEHAREELKLLSTPFDKKQAAYLKLTIALIHARKCEGSEATESAMEAMKTFKQMEDKMGEGVASYVLTFSNIAYDDLDAASGSAKEAMAIFKDLGDKKWYAGSLLALCAAATANDEVSEVFKRVGEAKAIYGELGDKKGSSAAELMIAEAWSKDAPDDALAAAEKALDDLKEIGHKKGQAHVLHLQARIHLSKDEPEMALQKEMEARRCCRRAEDRKGEAIMLQTITHAYFQKYTKALEVAMAAGDANSQRAMRDANRKAFKAAKDALGMAKRSDNRHLMGMANIQVTRCHLTNGRLDKALDSSQEALDNLREVNDRQQEAVALALNAEVLMVQKELEKAEGVARRAISLAQSVRDSGAEQYAAAVLNGIFEAEASLRTASALPAIPTVAATEGVSAPIAAVASVAAPDVVATLDHAEVTATILNIAKDVVGDADDLHLDSGLMDAGMDSLSAVAFRNTLMRSVKGVNLPASLMFDYPSINQIADYIVEESSK